MGLLMCNTPYSPRWGGGILYVGKGAAPHFVLGMLFSPSALAVITGVFCNKDLIRLPQVTGVVVRRCMGIKYVHWDAEGISGRLFGTWGAIGCLGYLLALRQQELQDSRLKYFL
jgi:hypothetical protein